MKVYAQRNIDIVVLRMAGTSWKDLATRFGISPSRVRQIYLTRQRQIENAAKGSPFTGLSTRAANVLSNNGIFTKEEAKKAIETGVLSPKGKKGCRNYGVLTEIEVKKWCGAGDVVRCPCCGQIIKSGQ